MFFPFCGPRAARRRLHTQYVAPLPSGPDPSCAHPQTWCPLHAPVSSHRTTTCGQPARLLSGWLLAVALGNVSCVGDEFDLEPFTTLEVGRVVVPAARVRVLIVEQ